MISELEQNGRAAIWLLSVSAMDQARGVYERFLSPSEAQRARRFVDQRSRGEFVAARALVRTRLAFYTTVPALEWQFAEDHYGRPFIVEPKEFRHVRFNLSHSRGLVACAFSTKHDIGIDVEDTTRDVALLDIASSSFAPCEARDVRSRSPEGARATFFSYWTLKEAYLKGRGMGLSIPLDSFWFDLTVESPVLHCTERCADDPERWQFRQWLPTPEHRLALAVAAGPRIGLKVDVLWADGDPAARNQSL